MSVFEATYTKLQEVGWLQGKVPILGIHYSIIASGLTAGFFRGFVDTPFQFAKVRGQTAQSWALRHMFTGLSVNMPNNVISVAVYFTCLNTFLTQTSLCDSAFGQFNASGISALICSWVCWPYDVVKSRVQATDKPVSVMTHVRTILQTRGI